MKKLFSLLFATAAVLSCTMFSVKGEDCRPRDIFISQPEHVGDIPRGDSDKVIKDGIIGKGEYRRNKLKEDPLVSWCDPNIFIMTFDYLEHAEAMCSTMEYYFSWDEEHGFNFAVRFKPHRILQEFDAENDRVFIDKLTDQTSICFYGYQALKVDTGKDVENSLIYAIAKRTEDGKYLEGHMDRLGPTHEYDPVPEEDFIIVYGDDGYVTCEWSVPFEKMGVSGKPGTDVYFSICCTAGDPVNDGDEGLSQRKYGVSLGAVYSTIIGDIIMVSGRISDKELSLFDDVILDSWYYEYVEYTLKNGLMQGKGGDVFAPGDKMTRAELVTVLYRLAGEPKGEYSTPFTDLSEDWYTDAVGWAYENNFTEGVADTLFAPSASVTREQTATFFARYLSSLDLTDFPMSDWLGYTYSDEGEISDWAIDGVRLMGILGVVEGYLDGEDNARSFRPRKNCTRAELAKIISVFDETVISRLK